MLFRRLGFWSIPNGCYHPDFTLDNALGEVTRPANTEYREPGWVDEHEELGFDQGAFMSTEVDFSNDVSTWHQDNANWHEIVLWCSVASTEILLPNGDIVAGQDGEVIVFDNHKCHHRIPLAAQGCENRHFIRLSVLPKLSLLSTDWISPL